MGRVFSILKGLLSDGFDFFFMCEKLFERKSKKNVNLHNYHLYFCLLHFLHVTYQYRIGGQLQTVGVTSDIEMFFFCEFLLTHFHRVVPKKNFRCK